MSGAHDNCLGVSGARRSASRINESSHRPRPTQIRTRTTTQAVFIGFLPSRLREKGYIPKGVYTPYYSMTFVVTRDPNWVGSRMNKRDEGTDEREFAEIARIDRHLSG